jgi:hypothetical protein
LKKPKKYVVYLFFYNFFGANHFGFLQARLMMWSGDAMDLEPYFCLGDL